MLQYQAQTFPAPQRDRGYLANTAACPESFTGGTNNAPCLCQIDELVAEFFENSDVAGQDGLPSQLPLCEALAQRVQYHLNGRYSYQHGFCFFFGNLITVTGGALTGPDADASPATSAGTVQDCKPVLPQSYQLHEVTYAMQNLYRDSQAAAALGMAGRTGFVPIITVHYSNDNEMKPSMQYYCMQAYAADGGPLPVASLEYESAPSAASKASRTSVSATIVVGVLTVSLL